MKLQDALPLIAALLSAHIGAQSSTPLALGEVTFGSPMCGDGATQSINTNDCATAVTQLLAAHCANGLCSIAAPSPISQGAEIELTVGTCRVSVAAFNTGDRAVTFEEDAVQKAFPGFIETCTTAGEFTGPGDPLLHATDGILELEFDNGVSGGG